MSASSVALYLNPSKSANSGDATNPALTLPLSELSFQSSANQPSLMHGLLMFSFWPLERSNSQAFYF